MWVQQSEKKTMKKEIWIAGYPSFCGGASSELDHNIDLWRSYDVDVHLVPTKPIDERMKKLCDDRGCHTHIYSPSIFKDKIVVSFCNAQFLERLPEIMEQGQPRANIFFNCMTYLFPAEICAHNNHWITHFGYVSNYQKQMLKTDLEKRHPVNELEGYRPFFNPQNISQQIEFKYRKPNEFFGMGRISRDDPSKFSADMWKIFGAVKAPIPTKAFVLGYSPQVEKKTGHPPTSLDAESFLANQIPVKKLYEKLHVMIHKTGGSRESYCRVVPEAYGYGVPVIVEDDYAFPDLVQDGVTGFRCKTSDEMSARATELSFDEDRRKKMIFDAQEFLITEIANRQKCWQAWEKLFQDV
jgi:glycosyltransferase involved in cell wall biosynthesis